MWQTPESITPPGNSTPIDSSCCFASSTSGTRNATVPPGSGSKGCPIVSGCTSASVTFAVSNSTQVSVEFGFRWSPSMWP